MGTSSSSQRLLRADEAITPLCVRSISLSRMCSLCCAEWGTRLFVVTCYPLISANMFGFTRMEHDMEPTDQAFLLIGLVISLGASLVATLHELEKWRERRRGREDIIRAAMRLVVVPKDRD